MGMLDGRVVAITGAGAGLGRAYARACADAGALLVLGDLDGDALERTATGIRADGGEVTTVAGDVVDPEVCTELVATALRRHGRLDGFVANAGLLEPGLTRGRSTARLRRLVAVNVTGVMQSVGAAVEAMLVAGSGSIVTVVSGSILGLPRLAHYGGTKGAVLGLTYGWAVELAGTGVRVNAISPLADTNMTPLMGSADGLELPSPDRIAPAVVALLSPATAHLHGQVVRFDGESLGLMAPPRLDATTTRAQWSADAVADALEGALGDFVHPVGLGAGVPATVV